MSIHDEIVRELLETKSLAALIYAIERGRELEFRCEGTLYFLSRHGPQQGVSLWGGGREQSFACMERLLEQAVLGGVPFRTAWKSAQIVTLF